MTSVTEFELLKPERWHSILAALPAPTCSLDGTDNCSTAREQDSAKRKPQSQTCGLEEHEGKETRGTVAGTLTEAKGAAVSGMQVLQVFGWRAALMN